MYRPPGCDRRERERKRERRVGRARACFSRFPARGRLFSDAETWKEHEEKSMNERTRQENSV